MTMPYRVERMTVLHYFEAATKAVLNAWARGLRKPLYFGSAPRPLLKYVPIKGAYNNLSLLNAIKFNNAVYGRQEIYIAFPVDGAKAGPTEFFEEQRSYCTGICVHEFVHDLQERIHPDYKQAVKRYHDWRQRCDTSGHIPTAQEWCDNYYQIEFEQQAHGAQAAVEMYLDAKPFGETKLFGHISGKLRGQSLPPDIEAKIKSYAEAYADAWREEEAASLADIVKSYTGAGDT